MSLLSCKTCKFVSAVQILSIVNVFQGMLNGSADVIVNEGSLLLLWKHECTRVFADRFTAQDDKDWFEKTIKMVSQMAILRNVVGCSVEQLLIFNFWLPKNQIFSCRKICI